MAKNTVPVVCALLLVAAVLPAVNAVTCYQCSGWSGINTLIDATTVTNCGLPFRNNDPIVANRLTTYTCEGVCVTETFYGYVSGVTVSSVNRLCTDVPITDGCHMVSEDSIVGLACIKTCTGELCNDGSDASSLIPSRMICLFFASAVTLLLKRTLRQSL